MTSAWSGAGAAVSGSGSGGLQSDSRADGATAREICAVVVTYNPPHSVIGHVKLLADEVNEVVVVDNGSGVGYHPTLRQLEGLDAVVLLREEHNGGLARALNTGLRHAIGRGFRWVATFDQDSRIAPGFFLELEAAYDACGYRNRVVVISPTFEDEGSAARISYGAKRDRDSTFAPALVTMTSGNLIDTSLLSRTGMFDERLFIDCVDFEFCLRCAGHGYRVIEAPGATLIHNLGQIQRRSFLGRDISVSNHAALRRYYMTRNRVLMYARYFRAAPAWIFRDAVAFVWDTVKVVCFERDVLHKLARSGQGFWHGLRGRDGQFPGDGVRTTT